MTLTQQFLLISILPLSFVVMIFYMWRSELPRRQVLIRFTLTLVAAAIWSSSVLRYYGGVTFSVSLAFTWGVIGTYSFGLAALGFLLTTCSHFSVPSKYGQTAVGLTLLLFMSSLALDPALWSYRLPSFTIAGQPIRQFDVWAAVWIASWLVPVLAAGILTKQVQANFPTSLYRNQIHYWLLVTALLLVGGGITSVRQPGHPAWQETGVLLIILAAFTGTVSISQAQLHDLQLVGRRILSRLSGTLILFGLTWAALQFIVHGVTNLPTDTDPNLVITLAAALFAGVFTVVYRLVNLITRRLFMPSFSNRELVMESYTSTIGNLPEPAQLGQLFLRIIQSNLAIDDAWFFVTEDRAEGGLILRPVAELEVSAPGTVDFDSQSPFVQHLRRQPSPIVQYDIDAHSAFDGLAVSERTLLTNWQRVLYVPLRTGSRLVGVIAIAGKHTGESFERGDLDLLMSMATQVSPLLAQAQNLTSLRQINEYVFKQNQKMAWENQHLTELSKLYAQFIALVAPELRQPYIAISEQMHQLQDDLADDEEAQKKVADLSRQINQLQSAIEQLINTSTHIQMRETFNYDAVRLDVVTQKAVRNLQTMAEARHVHIDYNPDISLPSVLGDEQQLREAVQHLLHNAIKFNKIDGVIQLQHSVTNGHLCLHVADTGVGIPEERMNTLWAGFSQAGGNGSRRSGLGLTLTHFIVAAHGGYIEARSEYGSGSVFSIYLPMMLEE